MTIERKTAVALKWNAAAKLFGQLISWFVTLFVLRILAPADYGLMAMVMVVMTVVSSLAEFGIGASLVQAQELNRDLLGRIATLLALLNLGCGMIVALAAPVFASWFGEPGLTLLVQVAALQFVFAAIEVVPQSLLQRELDFARVARFEVAGAMVSSFGTLVLALYGAGVWSLVLGWLAGAAVRAVLFASSGRFVPFRLNLHGLGGHMRFGGTVTVTRIVWLVTQHMDVVIAGRFLSRELVGLYSVAMNLATLPISKLMGVVNQVAFSAVSRLQDDPVRLRARLLDAIHLMALFSIPCLWGISSVAPEIVSVVLGPKWTPATIALQLVSLVAPARILMAILSTALAGIGRTRMDLHNTIIGAALLSVCLLVGVQWQLAGLAVAWLVALPLIGVIRVPRTALTLGIPVGDIMRALRLPVLGGAAMYGVVAAARELLPSVSPAMLLPLLVTLGAATYAGTILLADRKALSDLRRIASAMRG